MDGQTVAAALDEATAQARARLAGLRRDLAAIIEASDTATDDEHDPEGTTAFERAQVQSLIDATVEQLRDLDDARGRLDAGRYGGCEACGAPIDPDRLAARPMARTCIACARRAGRPARSAF
ncbi:MAG TPA: TraR/DksA family transcriptional regulator [Sporichthyaceae bacterium]|jgi:RNA polymerase-binding transcription factor DksA|nr:TraR/DksA family transcriptional regulator [Sporichthyaceae bacterium]